MTMNTNETIIIDYNYINTLLEYHDLNAYVGLNDNDYKRLNAVINNIDNLKAEYKKITDEMFNVFKANLSINHSNF
jgi:hypothetical protein